MNATRRPWANIFSATLLLCAAAGASAQTAAVPLNGLGATPQDGTLAAIDANWEVSGAGNGWDTMDWSTWDEFVDDTYAEGPLTSSSDGS